MNIRHRSLVAVVGLVAAACSPSPPLPSPGGRGTNPRGHGFRGGLPHGGVPVHRMGGWPRGSAASDGVQPGRLVHAGRPDPAGCARRRVWRRGPANMQKLVDTGLVMGSPRCSHQPAADRGPGRQPEGNHWAGGRCVAPAWWSSCAPCRAVRAVCRPGLAKGGRRPGARQPGGRCQGSRQQGCPGGSRLPASCTSRTSRPAESRCKGS